MNHSVQIIIGYVGGIVNIIAGIVYVYYIYKGKITSSIVGWGIWSLLTGIVAINYFLENGLVASVWVNFAYFISAVAAFIMLLIKVPNFSWSWIEKTTLVGVALTLVFWILFNNPIINLTCALIIDILGASLIAYVVYKDPSAEIGLPWYLGFLSNLINLFAVEYWNYSNAAYPIYLLIMTFIISTLVMFPRLRFN